VEVPVRWYNDPETKVRFLRDSSRMFADVCRIRWWSLCGVYPQFPARTERESARVGPSP
jgi:hypothetical protein